MGYEERTPEAGVVVDGAAGDWHTLILDAEGRITSGDEQMVDLLGVQMDALAGQSVTTWIPDLPFSAKTPGYNLAYAVFHGAGGTKVRRTARCAAGHGVSVDTVLSSHKVGGRRCIALDFRTTGT
ncbi:MAG: hypothetical protein V4858_00245 [Pseudomonadota bacterium]